MVAGKRGRAGRVEILARLAIVFGALSIFSFGGGNAVVPQMYADTVVQNHWVSAADFARFFALGKLAPGPTMTMGTLIGFAVGGLAGAVVATAALLVPAGIIVYTLGRMWRRFAGAPWREPFARAVPPVVIALLWGSIVAISRGALDGPVTYAFAGGALVLMLCTKLNQAVLMLIAGVAGAIVFR